MRVTCYKQRTSGHTPLYPCPPHSLVPKSHPNTVQPWLKTSQTLIPKCKTLKNPVSLHTYKIKGELFQGSDLGISVIKTKKKTEY